MIANENRGEVCPGCALRQQRCFVYVLITFNLSQRLLYCLAETHEKRQLVFWTVMLISMCCTHYMTMERADTPNLAELNVRGNLDHDAVINMYINDLEIVCLCSSSYYPTHGCVFII